MSDGDSFSETTTTSWFSRIGSSIKGILTGLALLAIGIVGLFWNEGRAVTTARSLTEGSGLVQTVDPARVDPTNEGKLIHVAGPVKVGSQVRDSEFGVAADGLRLVRRVEMYQWKEDKKTETKKNLGGSEETVTTYSYRREWATSREDSNRFRQPDGHRNPEMRFQGRDFAATDATVGAFKVDEPIVRMISASDELTLPASLAAQLRQRMTEPTTVSDRQIYVGYDAGNPRVGDLRITYQVARPAQISVIGKQTGGGFTPYQTQAGDALLMATSGVVAAAEMFKSAQATNTAVTWLIRAAGALGIFIGFSMILRPLSVIGDVVPFIGSIIGAGTGLVAMLLTAIVAPVVIAIAWFFYRPLVAIGILLVGAAVAFGLKTLASRRVASKAPLPAPATAG